MGLFHDIRYPGESDDYRAARDNLLAAEVALRQQVEQVAALRRTLPAGGALKEDYIFEEGAAETVKKTRFSDLFGDGKDILVLYGLMYAPDDEAACPMCTAFLDSLNGNAPHVAQRINLAVGAKAPIAKLRAWGQKRGWGNLRLLSTGGTSFNADYATEKPDGSQVPCLHVFQKTEAGVRHLYATEMLFATSEEGQHMRHMDMMWPLWNVFDLTPIGRGSDWFPGLDYS